MQPHQQLEYDLAGWLDRLGDREPGRAGVHPSQVVACSSGTAALHLALETLTAGLDDEERRRSVVIVPDHTMVSVARAVVLAGMRPVFCDVLADGPHAGTPNQSDVGSLFLGLGTSKVRAVIAVATCGRPCDPLLFDNATRCGIPVIEDLAEAHGVVPDARSYAACWSFYRNKIVAGEEGGAVLFQNLDGRTYHEKGDADTARQLRCVGFTPAHDYTHLPRGHNYRLADLLAVPILRSLARFEANTAVRAHMAGLYDEALGDVAGLETLPARAANWVYDVRVRRMGAGLQARLVRSLQDAGVAARFGFKPLSGQPEFGGRPLCPVAARLSTQVVHLPLVGAAGIPGGNRVTETVETAVRVIRSVLA